MSASARQPKDSQPSHSQIALENERARPVSSESEDCHHRRRHPSLSSQPLL